MNEIEQKILRALFSEGRSEAMVNAMQAAGGSETYETVFSVVMAMENRNYLKLVYCQFPKVINVQMTLVGRDAHIKLTKQ